VETSAPAKAAISTIKWPRSPNGAGRAHGRDSLARLLGEPDGLNSPSIAVAVLATCSGCERNGLCDTRGIRGKPGML